MNDIQTEYIYTQNRQAMEESIRIVRRCRWFKTRKHGHKGHVWYECNPRPSDEWAPIGRILADMFRPGVSVQLRKRYFQ